MNLGLLQPSEVYFGCLYLDRQARFLTSKTIKQLEPVVSGRLVTPAGQV